MDTSGPQSLPQAGGVAFDEALTHLDLAVAEIFNSDPAVRSVGIARHGNGFGFRVVRNSSVITPLSAPSAPLTHYNRVPLKVTHVPAEICSLAARVPLDGPGGPGGSAVVPERAPQRPLCAGLQIQNFDADERRGVFQKGVIIVGTLGCFVRTQDGKVSILSNNHVVGAENSGQRGSDRILQPGSSTFDTTQQIAVLGNYINLVPSPAGATPGAANVSFNVIDAGLATLNDGLAFTHGYLPARAVPAPSGIASAAHGDQVFKVGRTTGLTYGTVTDVATVVGPVAYAPGPCWFSRSIVVEGVNGTLFSDHGDSGSAVVKMNGEVIGLLYAGNGMQTYICPIDLVLAALACTLV